MILLLTFTHLLSGWPKKSSNFIFTTKMVFPKSLKFMNSGSEFIKDLFPPLIKKNTTSILSLFQDMFFSTPEVDKSYKLKRHRVFGVGVVLVQSASLEKGGFGARFGGSGWFPSTRRKKSNADIRRLLSCASAPASAASRPGRLGNHGVVPFNPPLTLPPANMGLCTDPLWKDYFPLG